VRLDGGQARGFDNFVAERSGEGQHGGGRSSGGSGCGGKQEGCNKDEVRHVGVGGGRRQMRVAYEQDFGVKMQGFGKESGW